MATPAPLASSKTRTNLCKDPLATSSAPLTGTTTGWAARWYGGSGAGTTSLVTGATDGPTGLSVPVSTYLRKTWTTAPTSDADTGFQHTGSGTSGYPVTPGQQYAVASFLRTSASGKHARCAWTFYDSTGTPVGAQSQSSSGDVLLTPGAWTQISGVLTVPAGVAYVLLFAYIGYSGSDTVLWAPGDTLDGTACLIEQATAVGSFFDGDTLNATWAGTANASASTLLVVSHNPNLPVLEVEAWPGVSPTLTGVPAAQGTILTDRAKAFKIARGRQYELDQDQAATGTLTLNNNDGQVTGGSNGCTPITSARVRARWNGITYPVWTGLIRSWPQQDDTPAAAWAEAELTDTFEPLANHPFGSLLQEEIRTQTTPDSWFPMNEPQSSTSIGNLVPGGVSAPLVNVKTGGVPFALGATSPFAGTSETVLSLANSTGATGKASQYQMVGPQNPGSGYSMPFGAPWAVGLAVRMTAGSAMVWSALDTDGTVMAGLQVDMVHGQIASIGRQGGPGATIQGTGHNTTSPTVGVYIHAGHDGTQQFLDIYFLDANGNLGASQDGLNVPITTGVSKWVAWGNSFSSSTIWNSSNADMQMCHGTIWTTSPPARLSAGIVNVARVALTALSGYQSQVQVGQLAKKVGITALGGDPADGQKLGQIRDTNKTSALDAIRQVTLDYLGRIFMSKDGSLTWQSVHHGMGKNPQWALGGQAGEQPYTGAPQFNYDPTYVYNDVQVQRPDNHGVDQQATTTKAIARAIDTTSQAAYFQRVLQVDSNVQADPDALAIAQYLLARYKNPSMRVQTVRFEPSANPGLWPFVLGAELGDTLTLNHRALGRPTISLTLAIQQISHDVDAAAGTWVTSMELAPWKSDWTLAAMHTTFAVPASAGALAVTLNPLPDSATNSAEQSLGIGTTMTLSPGTANAETLTIASVTSTPTANTAGYSGITVTFTAPTAHPHAAGDIACDPLPSGVTDPTTWDAFSVLGSTTVVSI